MRLLKKIKKDSHERSDSELHEIKTKINIMKKYISIISVALVLVIAGCSKTDDEFLDIPPTSIIPADVAFTDPALVLSILGDLYNRQLDFSGLDNGWQSFADFSESFPSENGSYFIVQRTGWDYSQWQVNWFDSYA